MARGFSAARQPGHQLFGAYRIGDAPLDDGRYRVVEYGADVSVLPRTLDCDAHSSDGGITITPKTALAISFLVYCTTLIPA